MIDLNNKINDYQKIIAITEDKDLLILKSLPKWSDEQMTLIMPTDIRGFKSFYNLYEFSNQVVFISKNISNYPTIFNYVETGILTIGEALETLLN